VRLAGDAVPPVDDTAAVARPGATGVHVYARRVHRHTEELIIAVTIRTPIDVM
jgi:hypothetical protein